MEASREERQLMRQRGAGTRKAKEVDFGFSFGSPALGLPAPAPLATVPEAQNPPRTQTAPNTTPRPLKVSQPGSQARAIERTPGSARNKLPERPSTYEIPSSDDRAEQTRSNKRRKISMRPENGDTHPVEHSAGSTESQTSHIQASPNTDTPPVSEITNNESSQPHTSPIPETSVQDQQPIEEGTNGVEPTTSTAEEPLAQGTSLVPVHTEPPVDEGSQALLSSPEAQAGVEQPENAEQLHEKGDNTRSPPRPEERIQINKNTETASAVQRDISATTALSPRGTSAEALEASHAPTTDDVDMTEDVPPSKDDALAQDNRTSQGPSTKKKPRGRPRHQPTANTTAELHVEAAVQEPASEAQDEPAAAQVEEAPKPKRARGRPSLNKKAIEAIETEQISPEATSDVAESSSGPHRVHKPTSQNDHQLETVVEPAVPKPRGRPGKKAKHAVEPEPEPEPVVADQAEPETESAIPKPQRGRPGKKAKRAAETEPEPEPEPATADQPEPEAESVVPKPRGRPGKKTRHAIEPEPEPETEDQPEPEVESTVSKPQRGRHGKKANRAIEPEPEPVAEEQPESEAESAAPKPQRGRTGKKAKRAVAPEPEPGTEHQPEPEATQEQPRRKTREPRGETVPVTVYRLANVNSLGGATSTADGSGDEEESADELTTHQRAKIPNRGGVNPADVLSQICRETLEKTLNTLKDGIANEANATRRAEWSRKRKAVEVFGSELESRLMDLSGILDSNFVLGVQLKKAKREMMDLRNHLYRVRRERENIALQMDAVRSRHIEGEKAKSSRSAISNSLHSLELALDRNKQRSASADPSTDLEYMLRTVADSMAGPEDGVWRCFHVYKSHA
ncbi:Pc18g06300 [Penicillium rubens Wisconsin 54-1255]|uniref:Pc18g06300 protein n=1 Tax=Penicillium rubens (strain ATCC 28089 / DSM 1075 / NRRL 1951 / Wisconsin 54-1255) TaxID=500485 RepID=B6HCM6_PENRW|nr:Pc18g06300 [Penicillium rubens Wisconsin 54-1255]